MEGTRYKESFLHEMIISLETDKNALNMWERVDKKVVYTEENNSENNNH